ncbi:hypothetical protein RWE15_22915 [Virgibacillus halophilus]|uniref:Uncharacterized protein n=2 Tax=Tigheibacillus halophilus TaxID=361280 RepID=A0ABU5CBE3_9BACI|nr:hypothetical protein [Virgibacillus halophilus]
MNNEISTTTSGNLKEQQDTSLDLFKFEKGLITYLQESGLPSDSVLVPVPQRINVYRNIPDALFNLSPESRSNSLYISKFVAAVTAGLFDAALNYLWDETINELRNRVVHYDLNYFF